MRRIIGVSSTVIVGGLLLAWEAPKPSVFLIGDSISIQYGPYLQEYLKDIAYLERKEDDGQSEKDLDVPTGANGGDSRMVLAYLGQKTADPTFKPDYVLLNCGLHDIKHKGHGTQVDSAAYRQHLLAIHELLAANGIRLIWMRTTNVIDSLHNVRSKKLRRYQADLIAFNRIADEVCAAKQIPTIDLYGLSVALGKEAFVDHVHYGETGRMAQAAYIAGFLQNQLKQL